jgi:hypothetical protein
MRKTLCVLLGGLTIASSAQAQPYGYYPAPGAYAYRYEPPRAYGPDGYYTPFSYYNGRDFSDAGQNMALLGSAIAPSVLGSAPFDRYGPNPNGMIAPDGHVIRCKPVTAWSPRAARFVRRRECW